METSTKEKHSVSKFLSVGCVSKEEIEKISIKADVDKNGEKSGAMILEDGVAILEGLFDSKAMRSAYIDSLCNFILCVEHLRKSGRYLLRGTRHGFREIVKRTEGTVVVGELAFVYFSFYCQYPHSYNPCNCCRQISIVVVGCVTSPSLI